MPDQTVLTIATRASQLATWQAETVRNALRAAHAQHAFDLLPLHTHADRTPEKPLDQFGTRGVFTREIQHAVLDGRAAFAVHSLKDLPTEPADGLCLGAVLQRGPVEDVLVSRDGRSLDDLAQQARVATGSLRRRALLLAWRPDLCIEPLRGNIPTRLAKIERQGLDAIVVARAALVRLGLERRVSQVLPLDRFLPGAGQGAIAVECLSDDAPARALLDPLDHGPTRQAVTAERALLGALGAGCRLPVGALAEVHDADLVLRAVVADPQGRRQIWDCLGGPAAHAADLGRQLAQTMLARGARELLTE